MITVRSGLCIRIYTMAEFVVNYSFIHLGISQPEVAVSRNMAMSIVLQPAPREALDLLAQEVGEGTLKASLVSLHFIISS